MTWTRDFRAARMVYNPVGAGSAIQIEGLTNVNLEAQPETRRVVKVGSIFAGSASLDRIAPLGTFSTNNISQAITALSLSGACIESDGTHPGLEVYYERRDCKGPAAGSVHAKYTVGKGIIVPNSISVDHRGDAVFEFQLYAAFDGTNSPVAIAHNQAIPASAGGADAKYTMNRMAMTLTVAGGFPAARTIEIEGKRNIGIQFNPDVASEGADSEVFDSVQTLNSLLSTMTVSGVDPYWYKADTNDQSVAANADVMDSIQTGRTLVGTSFLTVFFKDRDKPINNTSHASLTLRGLVAPTTIISGGPSGPAQSAFRFDTVEEGANAPVIGVTGIAIPNVF